MYVFYIGLIYIVLIGKRKQSVLDVEKLFLIVVVNWCIENGFFEEGRVVEIIVNWYKVSDGRGFDEEIRRKYNFVMLEFFLEDWMSWYQEIKDYFILDLNRFVKVYWY